MASSSGVDSPKKPSPVVVGSATAYAVRPPSEADERWYWQCKGPAIDGKRATLWSGRATPDEVARELAVLIVAHGPRPDAEVVRERRAITDGLSVAGLLARWLSHVEATADKYSPHTRRNYVSVATRLTEDLGGYRLDELTPALLERYHSRRTADGALKGTADFALRALRTAWNWGLRNRLLSDVWPKPSLRLRDRTTRERPDPDQLADVLAVLRRDAPLWCWRLAYVIAGTGMRVSEAWGLTVDDVVMTRRDGTTLGAGLQIRDEVGVAKTGARTVWVAPAMADEIARWVAAHAPGARLIGEVTQSTATMGAANYLRPAVRAVGGTWTGWHAFRRAAADTYADAGVDPLFAASQLGHTVQVMQSVYRTVRDTQALAAATAFAEQQAMASGPRLSLVDEEPPAPVARASKDS